MTVLDHIVIVADSLEQGLDYCEATLAIRPPKGGEHVRMGTHNHLLRLGDAIYLEVIAVNPAATAPKRRRWFGLDSPMQQERVKRQPYLATFVARTVNIDSVASRLPLVGAVQDMERGDLHWKITIPDDGLFVEGGTVPALIEWPPGIEPTLRMPDLGHRLQKLIAFHPEPHTLQKMWDDIGLVDGRLSIKACGAAEAPYLVAHIDTPAGMRVVSGKG